MDATGNASVLPDPITSTDIVKPVGMVTIIVCVCVYVCVCARCVQRYIYITRFSLRVGRQAGTASSKVEQLLPLLVIHMTNNFPEHSTQHISTQKHEHCK